MFEAKVPCVFEEKADSFFVQMKEDFFFFSFFRAILSQFREDESGKEGADISPLKRSHSEPMDNCLTKENHVAKLSQVLGKDRVFLFQLYCFGFCVIYCSQFPKFIPRNLNR